MSSTPKGQGIGRRLPPTPRAGLAEECTTIRPVSHSVLFSIVSLAVTTKTDGSALHVCHAIKGAGAEADGGGAAPRVGPSEGQLDPDIDHSTTLTITATHSDDSPSSAMQGTGRGLKWEEKAPLRSVREREATALGTPLMITTQESTDKDYSGGMRSEKGGLGSVNYPTHSCNRGTRSA